MRTNRKWFGVIEKFQKDLKISIKVLGTFKQNLMKIKENSNDC